jgi:hypothetical protein
MLAVGIIVVAAAGKVCVRLAKESKLLVLHAYDIFRIFSLNQAYYSCDEEYNPTVEAFQLFIQHPSTRLAASHCQIATE